MATLTVFADTADGYIRSIPGLTADSASATISIGVIDNAGPDWHYESFFSFDTSSLGGTATVSAAAVHFYNYAVSATDGPWTVQARLYAWTAPLTTSGWIAPASLSGYTLLAHIGTGSIVSGYNALVDDAMAANVNKTGSTRMVLHNKENTMDGANVSYGGSARWQVYSADWSGTANDPKLVVTYSAPVTLNAGAPDAIAFTGYAPTLKNAKKLTTASPTAITFTGYAPTLKKIARLTAASPTTIAFTGYAPTLKATKRLNAGAPDALTFTGYAPTLRKIARLTTASPTAITFTGYAPSGLKSAKRLAAASPTAIAFTGYAPRSAPSSG